MADENAENQMENLNKMKVADIKKLLKAQGLSTNGNKSELIQRLKASNDTSDSLLETTVTIDSEVFDEELEEDLDEVELMSDEKEDLDKHTNRHAKKVETQDVAAVANETDQKGPGKKVSSSEHNKQLSKLLEEEEEEEVMMDEDEDTKTMGGDDDAGDDKIEDEHGDESPEPHQADKDKGRDDKDQVKTDKKESVALGKKPIAIHIASNQKSQSASAGGKVIKISHVSNKEKLVKRAEKFGLSEAAKKELRAARFGIQTKASMNELLKKRAERFGLHPTVTATNINTKLCLSSEDGDVLKKRAQRFGITAAPAAGGKVEKSVKSAGAGSVQQRGKFKTNKLNSITPEERKMMRSMRFKVAT